MSATKKFKIQTVEIPKANFKTRVFIDYPWDKIKPKSRQCFDPFEDSAAIPKSIITGRLAQIRRACKLWKEVNNKPNWLFKISAVEVQQNEFRIYVWRKE